MSVVSTTISVLGGCCGCMMGIESLVKHPGTTLHLTTFATFLGVIVQGLLSNPTLLYTSQIPRRQYLKVSLLFFVISVINNESTNFDIPFPLFIIFRSGTLLANVLLTFLMQNRQFPLRRLASVLCVSIGIALFTIAERLNCSGPSKSADGSNLLLWIRIIPIPQFLIGILIMSSCLFGSAYMGIMQENLYVLYGKHFEEMMFNVHFLSFPLFILVAPRICADVLIYSAMWPNVELFGLITLPITQPWAILCVVVAFQLICLRNVYLLTACLSSLQVSMVLALRKFLNLLFSYLLFNNSFTTLHCIGSAMVLFGSFQFYDGFQLMYSQFCYSLRRRKVD